MKITLELFKSVKASGVAGTIYQEDELTLRKSTLTIELENRIYSSTHALSELTYLRSVKSDILQLRKNVTKLLIHEVLVAMEDVLVRETNYFGD